MIDHDINFVSAILILITATVPLYLSFRLKKDLKVLTGLLAAFLLSHAAYHILCVFGFEFLGEGILEPMSVVMLIIFGLVYLKTQRKQRIVA